MDTMPSSAREVITSSTVRSYSSNHHHRHPSRSSHPSPPSHPPHPPHPSHSSHSSRLSHPAPPAHPTAPSFSANAGLVSRSLSRMSAPHTLDISQLGVTAAPAEGQLIYQAPSQWQQSGFTPSTHRSSHMHVIPKIADDFSSIAGFMHNGAHVDVAVPMMSTNTIPSMNTQFYSNFEDQYNSNMFQDTQSYNPTQANGLSAMPEILGSGFSPYSQPSSHTPRHGSYQPQQNTTNYFPGAHTGLRAEPDQHMVSPSSAFESYPHVQQRPNPTNYSLSVHPRSRIEPGPPVPRPSSAFMQQPRMQQQRNPANYSLQVDPHSHPGLGIPMPHSPSASESRPHRNHGGYINHRPPAQTHQVHGGSSLHRHTSHNHTQEAAQLIPRDCRWRLRDNVLCGFVGSQEELKTHISSTHLSGPQDARVECRWEGCRHHRRGQSTDHTMRRDSVWRHVLEKHLDVKYRKKQ